MMRLAFCIGSRAVWRAALLLGVSMTAQAQMTPVGTWNSLDDDTKAVKAEIVIKEVNGVLVGAITQFLKPGADLTRLCTKCEDDRRDKLILGMEIIRGVKKVPDRDVWEGGKILDPENGKSYTLRLTPVDGGKRLDARGSIGPFGRTQTWIRVN